MSATGFVVTWLGPGTGGDDGIFGRRFDPDGVPTAGFQVNTATLSDYADPPDVAMNADGDFVVVWSDETPTYTVFGRRYDSSGAPLGSDFHVSTDTTRYVLNPKVVSDTTGNFLVTWTSFPVPHNGQIQVHARFFNFDGSSASGEIQVNEFTTALHLYPAAGPRGRRLVRRRVPERQRVRPEGTEERSSREPRDRHGPGSDARDLTRQRLRETASSSPARLRSSTPRGATTRPATRTTSWRPPCSSPAPPARTTRSTTMSSATEPCRRGEPRAASNPIASRSRCRTRPPGPSSIGTPCCRKRPTWASPTPGCSISARASRTCRPAASSTASSRRSSTRV